MKVEQQAFIGLNQITVVKKPRRFKVDYSGRRLVARFFHLGGGRQSGKIAEDIVDGILPYDDVPLNVLFCDTKDEPSWVYEHVQYLAARFATIGVSVSVLQRSELGLLGDIRRNEMKDRFASLPFFTRHPDGSIGRLKRQCTSEYKIVPAQDYVLNWLIQNGHAKAIIDKNGVASRRVNQDVYTEHIYGISYEEFWRAGNRGPSWQKAVYPLIDQRLTAQDCVDDLARRGLPIPEKSACRCCPYHDDAYWYWFSLRSPEEFEETCQFDDFVRSPEGKKIKQLKGLQSDVFLHQSCMPLRSIDFAALAEVAKQAKSTPLLDLCGDYCMT